MRIVDRTIRSNKGRDRDWMQNHFRRNRDLFGPDDETPDGNKRSIDNAEEIPASYDDALSARLARMKQAISNDGPETVETE